MEKKVERSSGVEQVKDDFELLEMMLADMRAAPVEYQPGNYWRNYERFLVPELRSKGLHDFRRRGHTVLSTFGATDYCPLTAASNKHPTENWRPTVRKFKRLTYVLLRNETEGKQDSRAWRHINQRPCG